MIAPGGRQVRKTIESEVTESHVGRSGSRWWGRKGDDGGIEEGNKRREFQRGEKRQGCVGVEQDKGGGKVRGVEVAGARGRRLPRNQCRGQGRGGASKRPVGGNRKRLQGARRGVLDVCVRVCWCVCPPQKKKKKKEKRGGGVVPDSGAGKKGESNGGGGGGRGTTGWLCPCVICPQVAKEQGERCEGRLRVDGEKGGGQGRGGGRERGRGVSVCHALLASRRSLQQNLHVGGFLNTRVPLLFQ